MLGPSLVQSGYYKARSRGFQAHDTQFTAIASSAHYVAFPPVLGRIAFSPSPQDNFLDSYLTQLHNDRPGAGPVQGLAGLQNPGGLQPMQTGGPQAMSFDQPGAAQQGAQSLGMLGQMPTQGLPGYGAGLAPGLNAGFPGLQAPMQANYAAPGLGGLSSNFGAGGLAGMPGLAGLVALQQQQQQGQMGLMPGAGPATSAHHTAATGTRGGGVSKPATRGRGGTRGGKGGRGGGNNKSEADQLSTSDHEDNSGSGSDGGGAENKPRKKQLTTDEAERRHLALQEKNRRAQRRFRERQKVGRGEPTHTHTHTHTHTRTAFKRHLKGSHPCSVLCVG